MKTSVHFCFVTACCFSILLFGSCAETNSAVDTFINSLDGQWSCEYQIVAGKRESPSPPQSMIIRYPSMSFLSKDSVVDFGWYRLESDELWRIPGQREIKYYSYHGTSIKSGVQDSILHEWYYNVSFDHDTLILNGVQGFTRISN